MLLALIVVTTVLAGPSVVKLRLKTFIERGLAERDVLVEKGGTAAGMVDRVSPFEIKGAAILSKPVYATTKGNTHAAAFGGTPGPFPKGPALGFTLGQWLAARGAGTLTVDGDVVELKLSFRRLVPNGVYTVWCVPVGGSDTPCGAADGSQNLLRVDASGNARFEAKMAPMPAHMKTTGTIIALAYHSDGKSYGKEPGWFGQSTHVQLVVVSPPLSP